MPILLALFLALAVVIPSQAAEEAQPTGITAVKADVMYWEGEEVVVKDVSGRELRLRVTAETKVTGVAGGRLKTGEKIAAQVASDGHVLSIAVQIPDGGMAPGSR
ncbi:MAG: hypothetical protein ABIR36_03485 [Nitrospiraceae bacterium]